MSNVRVKPGQRVRVTSSIYEGPELAAGATGVVIRRLHNDLGGYIAIDGDEVGDGREGRGWSFFDEELEVIHE